MRLVIWKYGMGVTRTLIEGEMKSQSTLGQIKPCIAALNWSALSDYGGTVVRGVRTCRGGQGNQAGQLGFPEFAHLARALSTALYDRFVILIAYLPTIELEPGN